MYNPYPYDSSLCGGLYPDWGFFLNQYKITQDKSDKAAVDSAEAKAASQRAEAKANTSQQLRIINYETDTDLGFKVHESYDTILSYIAAGDAVILQKSDASAAGVMLFAGYSGVHISFVQFKGLYAGEIRVSIMEVTSTTQEGISKGTLETVSIAYT